LASPIPTGTRITGQPSPLRRLLSIGVVLAALVPVLAGCAGEVTTAEGADVTGGKELFTQKCGACHVMQAAQTQGRIGPNLDDALGHPRSQGFEESTLFEVAFGQMETPVPPMPDFDEEGTKDYIPEEDRIAIAAFIAECARLDEKDIPAVCGAGGDVETTDGEAIFNQSCASCHTFAAAGSSGTIGPNLDDSQVSLEQAIEQIRNGGGQMPAFGDQFTDEQIEAVAQYIVDNRGG
jgi:mono/diheme cytochrome c family protein